MPRDPSSETDPLKILVFARFQENHFAWLGKEDEDLHIVESPWILVAESVENWTHDKCSFSLPT